MIDSYLKEIYKYKYKYKYIYIYLLFIIKINYIDN
jgi:hypothetical protein